MPLLCSLRISVQTYIEAPYLAPVFACKPIVVTLLCPEGNPRDKFPQSFISFQLFFPEESPKTKHRHGHLLTVNSR